MKEQVEAILSSELELQDQLLALEKLLLEKTRELESRIGAFENIDNEYISEPVSVHDFEPVGLFAE